MKNTDQITARIEAAERELAEAKRQLAEATKPEVPKYEPMKGGPCLESTCGGNTALRVYNGDRSFPRISETGTEYRTVEAAQASADYLNWFIHLLNLAAQVNPSGKAGGKYEVRYRPSEQWTIDTSQSLYMGHIFETREAAEKAAAILNASGGKLAGVPCPFIKS